MAFILTPPFKLGLSFKPRFALALFIYDSTDLQMFFYISQSFFLKFPQLAFDLPWEDTVLSDAGMQAHKQTATESAVIEPELKSIERWTCMCAERLCATLSVR